MKTSANGKKLIQAFESCLKRLPDGRYTTYRCPANVTTIGWGTTAADVPGLKDGEIWSKTRCDDVFAASLAKYEAAVAKVAGEFQLSQERFDALVSLTYNCGPGAVNGSIATALREGRLDDIPALIKRWNKARGRVLKGLVRRRDAEALMFAGDVDGAFRVADIAKEAAAPMPQQIDKPKPGVAETAKTAGTQVTVGLGLLGFLAAFWGHLPTGGKIGVVLFGLATIAALGMFAASKIRKLKETWA